ncbi:NifU family protein [Oscillibacter sp.]|uniref:NifU family protein n=1 Tax=Oscillibacter sp. TaxID=1945593 RepID=UPI002899F6BA|nr:NifU family protein [Oscillibacter sp.]
MYDELEAVLDERVRPLLGNHGGDIKVLEVKDGVVHFRFLGACAGCPAADLTNEELVQNELVDWVPGITGAVMVNGVSDDVLNEARRLLHLRHGG